MDSDAMPLPATMRSWVATRYGGPDVLELRDVRLPRPGKGEVLIRVQATTVSSADRRIRALDLPRGMGLVGRLALGIHRPRRAVLGTELTGIVVAAGPGATRFPIGQPVIAFPGFRQGAHADYVVMPDHGLLVPRPSALPLAIAAALGFGGLTARDYLRRAGLRAGERVLVIGASGTVGAALVQLATLDGAIVTAVTSSANRQLARDFGAAETIDYTQRDVTEGPDRWDLVADAVGAIDFRRSLPILADGGRYLAIAGGLKDMLVRRRGRGRAIAGPAAERIDDLVAVTDLAACGRFRPPIDGIYPFESLPEAHARADTGHKRGSLVIMLEEAEAALPPLPA